MTKTESKDMQILELQATNARLKYLVFKLWGVVNGPGEMAGDEFDEAGVIAKDLAAALAAKPEAP